MFRSILHVDLDAFFCAVEELKNPALRGKPFAVGNHPDYRGVVASCSYAARQFGVRSAMAMGQAMRLCPGLIVVQSSFGEYGQFSRRVMEQLENVTPLVEQLSIDEAFMDVSGHPTPAPTIAQDLQAQINQELGLPVSIGVAGNKLVAKIANNIGKAQRGQRGQPPNAITVVPHGQEASFLAPLEVGELWGVGPKTAERLGLMGIKTIGDLAAADPAPLLRAFGKLGGDLHRRANGIDDRAIVTERETKSISKETTFMRDVTDGDLLYRTIRQLSEGVGWRLRKADLSGTTIKIKLRWSDFTTLTRQMTLQQPTQNDDEITAAALVLLEQTWPKGRPVRLIGVGVSGLDAPRRQLSLWDAPTDERKDHLQQTLDHLRDRFGRSAITRASDLADDDR